MQASDETEEIEEPSFQDLARQTGQLVDDYDEDYEERQPAPRQQHPPSHAILQTEVATNSIQQLPPTCSPKVMSIAADLVKCYFITENAFPSKGQRADVLKVKFEEALDIQFGDCNKYLFTTNLEQLLASEESNVRGRLKAILLILVPQVYGLRNDAAAVTENKERVRFLLERTEDIHYRFHRADPAVDEKLFRHDIIERTIHEAYFKHRDSIGVIYSSSFNPIPRHTIALVLTVLHHCLTLWETGTLIKQNIMTQWYTEYDGFLGRAALGQMQDGELGNLWTILRQQMFERGIRAVGAQLPEQAVSSPTKPLSSTRLERELLQLQAELGLPSTSQNGVDNAPPPKGSGREGATMAAALSR
ncbi:hypothetical protein LXA43DRAFT_1061826 [Ganoderma leucocontextum]|nr:hypothetical protein LXA43DRAFT_1061826 [Ganoderma leucocontextum]